MALTSTRLTADEYFALPLTTASPERRRTQLIDGEIVVTEAVLRHQRIGGEIYFLLTTWLRANPGHGEAGIPVDV